MLRQFILRHSPPLRGPVTNLSLEAHCKLELKTSKRGDVYNNFREEHTSAAKAIKRAGGVKRVAQDFPHLVSWHSEDLQISAPLQKDQALILASFKPPIEMEDAFRKAGGSLRDFKDFGKARSEGGARDESGAMPTAVAIDTEGVHLSPPLLVQICPVGSSRVYLEQPSRRGGLSAALARLLADPSVTKAFFDAKGDVRSLGVSVRGVVDVQGSGNLAEATGECFTPPRPCRKSKAQGRRFGFYRTRQTEPLPDDLRWYAACDAWATALVYERIHGHGEKAKKKKAATKEGRIPGGGAAKEGPSASLGAASGAGGA